MELAGSIFWKTVTEDLICTYITLNKPFWASRIQRSVFVAVEWLSMSTILTLSLKSLSKTLSYSALSVFCEHHSSGSCLRTNKQTKIRIPRITHSHTVCTKPLKGPGDEAILDHVSFDDYGYAHKTAAIMTACMVIKSWRTQDLPLKTGFLSQTL